MISAKRGEVVFKVEGIELSGVLRYNLRAIDLLEQELDKSFQGIMEDIQDPTKLRTRHIALLLWAGLKGGSYQKVDLSVDQVMDQLELENVKDVMEQVGKALTAAAAGSTKETPQTDPTETSSETTTATSEIAQNG